MNTSTDQEKNEELTVRLSVGEFSQPVSMSVPVGKVTLRRMLPVIQKISSGFISMGEGNLRDAGKEISCRAGCGACCRQLVPIAEAEAIALREYVDGLDEPKRSEITSKFAVATDRLNKVGFFDRLDTVAADDDESSYDARVREYFNLQIACPFLENESCSIHEVRPIACREYLVTSPPEYCASADGAGVDNVHHFFQVKEALISLSRERTSENLPFVPLIRLMEFTDSNVGNSAQWTGKEWMQGFFTLLSKYSRPV